MTPQRANELLPIITAFAKGKTIQFYNPCEEQWQDVAEVSWNSTTTYRIKPDPHWYRVALFDDNGKSFTQTIDNHYNIICDEKYTEAEPSFLRWLTPRIEYEV